jgi:L-2-hydroxyglutarate oxidase LhgO
MDAHITIIGAGVVGLALAAELSKYSDAVFVIEKHDRFGQETSSRNSEIIHSGVYYPENSLKAILCVTGKKMLIEYCDRHDVAYRLCGKMIVSQTGQDRDTIEKIARSATRNGVTDHQIIGRDEIKSMEPHISARKAVFFPSTGILDTHGLMKALETEAISQGVQIVYGSEVKRIRRINGGYEIELLEQNHHATRYTSTMVINSAGLMAEKIARMAGIDRPEYRTFFWKGEYFSLQNGKHQLLSRLVYPVPEPHHVGLGIHTTLDLSGRVKLGPNAIFLPGQEIDYSIDASHKDHFLRSVESFLPFVEPEDLAPDQVGIRPKLQKPGDPVRDFVVSEESRFGFPGFVNLLGIESPGLTACLSLARYVRTLLDRTLDQ